MVSHSLDVLSRLSPTVPAALAERAEQWSSGGLPVEARLSASVVVLRETDGRLETYLLHRHARMSFAPSMVVFPGGRLDPADAAHQADPIRICACRETEEETGLVLAPVDLQPWAHWVTPAVEPRRYDTQFFVAVAPVRQEARDISGETDRAEWTTPAAALAAERRGDIALMPPTLSILTELAEAGSLAAVLDLARERVVETVLPEVVRGGDGWRFRYPEPGPIRLVRAGNPGPMTLTGTNTWILGDPSQAPPIVVDPGPLLAEHLEQILTLSRGQIGTIVLTHRHLDHAESAPTLAERAGCGVRAADPSLQLGSYGLADGEVFETTGVRVEVVSTPGHTSDSTSLLVTAGDGSVSLLSGDTVLGQGTTVITHPDGNLAHYLTSLTRLQELVAERVVSRILPGHGPVVDDPPAVLAYYRRHREERLDQVRAALAAGDRTPAQVVARVYADIDRTVWPAAEQSVRAQLDFLQQPPST